MLASLGDLLTDVTVLPTVPVAEGDDTPATIRIGGGGQAANWCAWVAHLGGRARLITKVGDDPEGLGLIEELEAGGVHVCAARGPGSTGAVVATIGPDGERSFFTQRGVVPTLATVELERAWLTGLALLHLPLYSLFAEPLAGAARSAVGWARGDGALLAIDLSSAAGITARGAAEVREELQALGADLLFGTEAETSALGARLDDLGELAVIKLGQAGCRIGARTFPAVPAEVVDATGAGDAFAAAFCLNWVESCDVGRAADAALRAGARAVGKLGGRP